MARASGGQIPARRRALEGRRLHRLPDVIACYGVRLSVREPAAKREVIFARALGWLSAFDAIQTAGMTYGPERVRAAGARVGGRNTMAGRPRVARPGAVDPLCGPAALLIPVFMPLGAPRA